MDNEKTTRVNTRSLRNTFAAVFSLALILGIVVCTICDLAISGSFSWSLYPITAIILAWFIFYPAIKLAGKGVVISLAAVSVFVIPYLWVQSLLIGNNPLTWLIGYRMALIAIPFFWVVFGVFKFLKTRRLIAASVSLLLTIPVQFLVNYTLSTVIENALVDVWDMLAIACILAVAIVFFTMDLAARRRASEEELEFADTGVDPIWHGDTAVAEIDNEELPVGNHRV